jgi:hypothetical protein
VERLAASPGGVDLDRSSAARVYGYHLGGSADARLDYVDLDPFTVVAGAAVGRAR